MTSCILRAGLTAPPAPKKLSRRSLGGAFEGYSETGWIGVVGGRQIILDWPRASWSRW